MITRTTAVNLEMVDARTARLYFSVPVPDDAVISFHDLPVNGGSISGTARVDSFFAGDANRDGLFDQHDIVKVLEADKYRTGQPATWEEGDWNRDGGFDQEDIVLALQTGRYLQSPQASNGVCGKANAVNADPENENDLVDRLLSNPYELLPV